MAVIIFVCLIFVLLLIAVVIITHFVTLNQLSGGVLNLVRNEDGMLSVEMKITCDIDELRRKKKIVITVNDLTYPIQEMDIAEDENYE